MNNESAQLRQPIDVNEPLHGNHPIGYSGKADDERNPSIPSESERRRQPMRKNESLEARHPQ